MTDVIRLPTRAPSGKNGELWETGTTGGLKAIIENCRLTAQLGLITGPSGIGKTTAAKAAIKAARSNALADAIYGPELIFASMTQASEGLQPGMLRIARAAQITVSNHMGAHDVFDALISHDWDEGSLIVLDEAQFMGDALLHAVRNLWDDLEQRARPVGIVLIGTQDLAERIKGRGKKSLPFEALRGRLGASLEMSSLEPEDFAAICQFYELSEKRAEALLRLAASHSGGLHNVRRLIVHAQSIAKEGKRITFSDLKQAAELTGVAQ